MKKLLAILFVTASMYGKASEAYLIIPYSLMYDSLDNSLNSNQSLMWFDLTTLDKELRSKTLVYAIDDGENQTYDYAQGDTLKLFVTPGEHTFQFFAGSEYQETPKMSLQIEEKHRQLYRINFSRTVRYELMKKPVIYLYPEENTDVSVRLQAKGDLTFTYPEITSGWDFSCDPDGTLRKEGSTYRYLFWESEQTIPSELFAKNSGKIAKGHEASEYLEMQMKQFGMTSEERADFITFWGPILQTKSNLYIYLLFNEVCDEFASLDITPKPTEIGRFYVLWAEVPDDYNPPLETQTVPRMKRDGFTVLEWGGAEVDASKILLKEL